VIGLGLVAIVVALVAVDLSFKAINLLDIIAIATIAIITVIESTIVSCLLHNW